jgi:TorA maturation chaperone TorD
MRDSGLDEAIKAAGGVGALARAIGISQPSVSNWSRVPSDRVLSVESVTGVSRVVLRPDLFATNGASTAEVDPLDVARAKEYALLATLLARAPNQAFLDRLTDLGGDTSRLGAAHAALAEAAEGTDERTVEREFFKLFVGVGRGEMVPYGSYYLTGFLNERPLARLRGDLQRLGIERRADEVEPEDRASTICELMSGLAGGRFQAAPSSDRQFFHAHVAPWLGRFFADLEQAEAAKFYRAVGHLGRLFIEIETEAFKLSS